MKIAPGYASLEAMSTRGFSEETMDLASLFRKKSVERIQLDAASGLGDAEHGGQKLKRALGVVDLTALGIAAVIGAGIFSTIGSAAFNGGPGSRCCSFSPRSLARSRRSVTRNSLR